MSLCSRHDGASCPHTWQDRAAASPTRRGGVTPLNSQQGGQGAALPRVCPALVPSVPSPAPCARRRRGTRWQMSLPTLAWPGWHGHPGLAGLCEPGSDSRALAQRGRSGAVLGGSHRPPVHVKPLTHATGWDWGHWGALGQPPRGGHPPKQGLCWFGGFMHTEPRARVCLARERLNGLSRGDWDPKPRHG